MYISVEFLITFGILFGYLLIKYLKKDSLTTNLVQYERKKTILNLSKSKKKKIWLKVGSKKCPYSDLLLVSGIVEDIIHTYPHHSIIFSSYENYCIGKFIIRNDVSKTSKFYIDNIREVSLKPFSEIIPNFYSEENEDSLSSFDFIGDATSYDNRYYKFLSKLQIT